MKKKYKVKLAPNQRKQLLEIVQNRKPKQLPTLGYSYKQILVKKDQV